MYLTEKEILARQQEQLFGVQKILKNSGLELDDITELIPGLVHLNKIHSLDLFYIDKQSRQVLEIKKEDMVINGSRIVREMVKPESFLHAKKLFGKVDFQDPSQVISHFQEIKGFDSKGSYKWFYSVKKRFNDKLILTISNPVQNLGAIHRQLEKLLEENLFIRKNLPKVNCLTPREKEVIRLIFKGYDSKQLAEKLFISIHTVRTHRKNIWRKLEINSYAELYKFAGQFELV